MNAETETGKDRFDGVDLGSKADEKKTVAGVDDLSCLPREQRGQSSSTNSRRRCNDDRVVLVVDLDNRKPHAGG